MGFKTILVPTGRHEVMSSTLETAVLLGQKFDSYIEGFALRVAMPVAFATGDVSAMPIPWEAGLEEDEKHSRGLFESFMQQHGVPCGAPTGGLSSSWLENAPDGDQFVGSHGRIFDVIVLGRPGRDRNGPRITTLEAALFESGRPVLIATPSPRPQMGTNVLIAWNCSTEQATTTALAMPLLQKAGRVIVLTVRGGTVPGPTGEQLARCLARNGVRSEPMTVELEGRSTGETILAHAASLNCDLLIKGAYTQSRLRQMIFGGATRHILANAALPVLMAH